MNTYLIVKTLHIISATLMVGTGFWYSVLPLLGKPQRFGCRAVGRLALGHQSGLVVYNPRRHFPAIVRLMDAV